jgi:hypothetical protein
MSVSTHTTSPASHTNCWFAAIHLAEAQRLLTLSRQQTASVKARSTLDVLNHALGLAIRCVNRLEGRPVSTNGGSK